MLICMVSKSASPVGFLMSNILEYMLVLPRSVEIHRSTESRTESNGMTTSLITCWSQYCAIREGDRSGVGPNNGDRLQDNVSLRKGLHRPDRRVTGSAISTTLMAKWNQHSDRSCTSSVWNGCIRTRVRSVPQLPRGRPRYHRRL